jgi:hypothetical protein
MITNKNNLPYSIYVIKNIDKGEVNVILPANWEITLPVGAGVDTLVTALEKYSNVTENAELFETLMSVLNSIDMQTLTVNGAEPETAGVYDVTAIAFGNRNYKVAMDYATLTIKHQLVKTEANGAGCLETGNSEYWTCSECGKFFSDAEGLDEIEKDSWFISANGHTEVKDAAVKPTCTETGLTEGKHCDVCGEVLVAQTIVKAKGHADNNNDHYCDYGCGENLGECVDADKDHACDYGCDKIFGSHTDDVKDHICDYCGEKIGDCGDANGDGKCDDCESNYGECVDADKNHICDKHGEELSTHTISEGKHECDYCGTALSECADFDNNGKCDVCGAELGTSNAGVVIAIIASVVAALGAVFAAYWFFVKKAPTAPTGAPEVIITEAVPEKEIPEEETSEEEIPEEDDSANQETDVPSEE